MTVNCLNTFFRETYLFHPPLGTRKVVAYSCDLQSQSPQGQIAQWRWGFGARWVEVHHFPHHPDKSDGAYPCSALFLEDSTGFMGGSMQYIYYIYTYIYLFLDIMTLYMWFLYVGLINLSDFRVLQNHLSLITVDIEEEAFPWVLLDVGGFFKTVFNSQGGSLISFE